MARRSIVVANRSDLAIPHTLQTLVTLDAKIAAATKPADIAELIRIRGEVLSQDPNIQRELAEQHNARLQLILDYAMRFLAFGVGAYLLLPANMLSIPGAFIMAVSLYRLAPKLVSDVLRRFMRSSAGGAGQ